MARLQASGCVVLQRPVSAGTHAGQAMPYRASLTCTLYGWRAPGFVVEVCLCHIGLERATLSPVAEVKLQHLFLQL